MFFVLFIFYCVFIKKERIEIYKKNKQFSVDSLLNTLNVFYIVSYEIRNYYITKQIIIRIKMS
jgi:hypothetical protein